MRDAREARVVARRGGTLTGPRRGERLDIAAEWLRTHLPELGLTRADLGSLGRPERSEGANGLVTLQWRQQAGGIPAFDGGVDVTVTRDGRVLSAAGAAQADLDAVATEPVLDAAAALRRLMDDVGVRRPVDVVSGPSGPERATAFAGDDRASLVVFGEGSGARLGWRLLYQASSLAWYAAVVDARTGAILYRANLVHEAVPARVWEQYPGAPRGGSQRTVDIEPYLRPGATRLDGPNAFAFTDVDGSNGASAAEHVTPGAYDFLPFLHPVGACDPAHLCSWNADVDTSWEVNRRQSAVQAFYFANRFHDHLAAPPIGFDAADGNFEGADPVRVETHDGVAAPSPEANNANMATPPDGVPPRMQMYLWFKSTGSPFRDANGADDAAVVYHEYAHGLSSRLVTTDGTPDGDQALNLRQPMAMGEGWSDWYAKDFLVGQFPGDDTAEPGDVHLGAYLDSVPNSLRTQALDCPVGAPGTVCPASGTSGPGGYTYGDYGKLAGGADSEHDNGEIWAQTLWDVRYAVGPAVARGILTQAMRLTPPGGEPTFLQMRDLILLADQGMHAGAHEDELWAVFARRGMGFGAATSGPDDASQAESFALPAGLNRVPAGTLAATPAEVDPGETVQLTAAFADGDGDAVGPYAWDFDGDHVVDSTTAEAQTSFAYATPGTYPARVTAADGNGGEGAARATVRVTDPAPPAPTPTATWTPTPTPTPTATATPTPTPTATATPAATATPSPTPTATPTPTPTATAAVLAPIVRLPARGRRARVRFTVDCDSACAGTGRITVSRRLARRLRLGRTRTVTTVRVRLPAAGRRAFTARLTLKARRGMRRARLRRIAGTARVVVRDAERQRGTARRTVRVAR